MKRSTALSILLPLLVISSCLEDKSPIIPSAPLTPEEAQVIANCYVVQQAAEDFAAANGGVYASNVSLDTNLNGDTIINLLPGGTRLENPFTGSLSEPGEGPAARRGETGYLPAIEQGVNVNYTISGKGENLVFVLLTSDTTIINLP